MAELKRSEIEGYLQSVIGSPVTVLSLSTLGRGADGDVKSYGYGVPLKVDFSLDGALRTAVLHTIDPGAFGHENMADRARELLWEHRAFNCLPRHVRSIDVCGFQSGGHMISIGNVEEFCLVTEYLEGQTYAQDLERIRDSVTLSDLDQDRAEALCDYLVEIHKVSGIDAGLYRRRVRELVGDGECIMGITDSWPDHSQVPSELLEKIEHLCVGWRWRLKALTHRLRQVHGDFHPWNILFRTGVDFSVLDRSRGEYGDPADDVTSLTLNYVFFSLQRSGRLEGAFEKLFLHFWDRYLEKTGDQELLRVVAPFLAFRGLVMASPVWYPSLSDGLRGKLLRFVLTVLEAESFDPKKVNEYCGV
jgi:hypothetical protein